MGDEHDGHAVDFETETEPEPESDTEPELEPEPEAETETETGAVMTQITRSLERMEDSLLIAVATCEDDRRHGRNSLALGGIFVGAIVVLAFCAGCEAQDAMTAAKNAQSSLPRFRLSSLQNYVTDMSSALAQWLRG